MRVPIRKPGKYTHQKPDPHLTAEKLNELKNELEKLKKVSQPQTAREVARLAQLGDLSENAAYQIAKGQLRGINQRIIDLENYLHQAVIIAPQDNASTVQLGRIVTIEIDGRQKKYQILGSSETDPLKGIISHNSPIGSALMGRPAGDKVKIRLKDKEVECEILKIE
jgi:transcription elongation factor GreA